MNKELSPLEEIAVQAQEPVLVSSGQDIVIERISDDPETLDNLFIERLTAPTHNATRTVMTGPSLETLLAKEDKDEPFSSYGATD